MNLIPPSSPTAPPSVTTTAAAAAGKPNALRSPHRATTQYAPTKDTRAQGRGTRCSSHGRRPGRRYVTRSKTPSAEFACKGRDLRRQRAHPILIARYVPLLGLLSGRRRHDVRRCARA